jgi:hypothetical protein
MVRAVGIEPTLLAERDFESRASTNSTTPALGQAYSAAIKTRNGKSRLSIRFRGFSASFWAQIALGQPLPALTADASRMLVSVVT